MMLLPARTLITSFLAGLTALTLALGHLSAAENLVLNPDFSQVDDGGQPLDWKLDQLQPAYVDIAEKPEGAAASLRLEITEDKGKKMGQVIQVVNVGPNEAYRVSAMIRVSKEKMGELHIKVRQGKDEKETMTLQPTLGNWAEVSATFATQEADNVVLICRYTLKGEHIGATVAFSQIQLTRLQGAEEEAVLKKAEQTAAGNDQ